MGILGALIVQGIWTAALISAFWDKIAEFYRETLRKAQQAVQKTIERSRAFVQKVGDKIKVIMRHYYRDKRKQYEYVCTETIPASKVPPEIRERAKGGYEVDVTSELLLHLNG